MTNVLSMYVVNVIDFLTITVLQNKHYLFKCCTYLRADLSSYVASNEVNESANNNNNSSNNTRLNQEKVQDRKKQK